MASASSPVGVRLWETCNAAGAMPAPVRASVTWAVAGFGDPAASRPRASVTVFLTVSVAAASGPAAGCPPDVSAGVGAASASAVAGPEEEPAVAGVAVAGSAAPGWTIDGVPPTHPAKAAASAAPETAATRQRAARTKTEGADTDPRATGFCRWSGVVRMVSFCHVVRQPAHNPGGQGAAGGVPRSCPPGKPGGR
jgi:hypothetical protein